MSYGYVSRYAGREWRIFGWYLLEACFAAALTYDFIDTCIVLSAAWDTISLGILRSDVVMSATLLPFIFIAILIAAAIPAFLGFKAEKRWEVGRWADGFAGAVADVLAAALYATVVRAVFGDLDDDGRLISWFTSWERFGLPALPSGIVGGFIFGQCIRGRGTLTDVFA